MSSALDHFRREFGRWVISHNKSKGFSVSPDEIICTLDSRIPHSVQMQIGAALVDGWIKTDDSDEAGYCVIESTTTRQVPRLATLSHIGDGRVAPCWELYVQLADYNRLRTIAEPRGLEVRLEDQLMDIVVWSGDSLLIYVENKETKSQASSLLKGMRICGGTGFSLEDSDLHNDPLRKAKYLFRRDHRPRYFALSAIEFQQLYAVEYLGNNNQFRLVEEAGPMVAPLFEATPSGTSPARRAIDSFALELNRLGANEVWVSPGSGQTAYNVYFPVENRDAVALGIYESGEVWTDLNAMGDVASQRLIASLASLSIAIDTTKSWAFWKSGSQRFNLADFEPIAIANSVCDALFCKKDRND